MRQLFLFTFLLYFGVYSAQTIDLRRDTTPSPFQKADAGAMTFGDIDNDGDDDLIITGKGTPLRDPAETTLYINNGSGNFSAVMGAPLEQVYGGAVGFSDVDNDMDLDLLITGSTLGGFRSAKLYQNDGTGSFSLVSGTPFIPNWGGDFAFGDIDGDGDTDVVMTGIDQQDNAIAKLYENQNIGSGTFVEITGIGLEAVGNSAVEFIDIDKDNDLDIILAGENNQGNRVTHLYTNDGNGNFTLVANTPFDAVDGGDIAIADTDKDGDMDILISGSTGVNGSISKLFLNDGSGTFNLLAGTPFYGAQAGETDFADFDNDGDMDVLITGFGAAIISNVYENLGGNDFVLADSLAGAYASSTAIGDLDGDQDLDIVIGGTSFTAPIRGTKVYYNETPIQTNVEAGISSLVQLYPNPSKGFFQLKSAEPLTADVHIFNTQGQCVYSNKKVNISNLSIELQQPAGLYILVISSKNLGSTHRLILK